MIRDERKHKIASQRVVLGHLSAMGWILDVGGGGEGIIGQLMGEKVVAIDPIPMELEDAAEGPLKIIMDARELKFLDNTFYTATAFFSFLFMNKNDHAPILREILRVLKPGGSLHIWDVTIPTYDGQGRDIFVIPLEVCLPGKNITTGYGCLWPENERDPAHYTKLAVETGFVVESVRTEGETFSLTLRKKE